MDSKDYVLNHDFGYGREPELYVLFKLELRNLEDVKVYVLDSIKTMEAKNVKVGWLAKLSNIPNTISVQLFEPSDNTLLIENMSRGIKMPNKRTFRGFFVNQL